MLKISPTAKVLTAMALIIGFIYAAPNALPGFPWLNLPSWAPGATLSLGLDLQGGSSLLLELDVEPVYSQHLEIAADDVAKVLRTEGIEFTKGGANDLVVDIHIKDSEHFKEALELVRGVTTDAAIDADEDRGVLVVALEEDAQERILNSTLNQSLEIVRRRIDETGAKEPLIQRQGDQRILVQAPGESDPERLKALLGQTAQLNFHLLAPGQIARKGQRPGPGQLVLPSDQVGADGEPAYYYLVERRVRVSGENLVDAQPSFADSQPVVSFRFDNTGGRKFANTTRQNVGRQLAIVLDSRVISAPSIEEPILGGAGIIRGGFTAQQVQDLSLLLRAGALPAPLTVLEERTVGPGLGQDSIDQGSIASIIGFAAVLIYMVMAYHLYGLFAALALAVNLVLVVGVMSPLGATLTLPGIAGLVLTVGMAVDANVLIFERIREEFAGGQGIFSAIDAGYQRALGTILDSNLTTLIAALLLYTFGAGPVRGFAVTLSIGIICSMFSAIMLTRIMVVTYTRTVRLRELPI